MINNNSLTGVAALTDAVVVALASHGGPAARVAWAEAVDDEVECSWFKRC